METIITTGALFQRMKRAFRKEGNILKKSRPAEYHDLGDFYVIDERSNVVVNSHLNISELYEMAIDKGVVSKSERLPEGISKLDVGDFLFHKTQSL